MSTVYLLWHVYEKENKDDEEKLIGVYSSEGRAKEVILRLRGQPGFRSFPDGFQIHAATLDQDSWLEGFAYD